jgi:toxin ParE1/3/4
VAWGFCAGTNQSLIGHAFDQALIATRLTKLFANTRSIPVESHITFYRLNENLVEIIRVLHSRQDPERHI